MVMQTKLSSGLLRNPFLGIWVVFLVFAILKYIKYSAVLKTKNPTIYPKTGVFQQTASSMKLLMLFFAMLVIPHTVAWGVDPTFIEETEQPPAIDDKSKNIPAKQPIMPATSISPTSSIGSVAPSAAPVPSIVQMPDATPLISSVPGIPTTVAPVILTLPSGQAVPTQLPLPSLTIPTVSDPALIPSLLPGVVTTPSDKAVPEKAEDTVNTLPSTLPAKDATEKGGIMPPMHSNEEAGLVTTTPKAAPTAAGPGGKRKLQSITNVLSWNRTLLFKAEQLQAVFEAIDAYESGKTAVSINVDKTGNKVVQTSPTRPNANAAPGYYLNSLMYISPTQWAIWINGKRITTRGKPSPADYIPSLEVLEVTPYSVRLQWKTIFLDDLAPGWEEQFVESEHGYQSLEGDVVVNKERNMVKFTLRPNQTFIGSLLRVEEGNHQNPGTL